MTQRCKTATDPSYNSDLSRLQAEIAASIIRAKPDHSVPVDLSYLEYLSFVRLQARLILRS
jgi:hypothetical protein